MNREIKYRGQRSDNKEWVSGHYFEHLEGIRICHCIIVDRETKYFVDINTVGLFGGYKDKNGKDIYEDDILKGFKKHQSDKSGEDGFLINSTVRWNKSGFEVFERNLQSCYTSDNNMIRQFMYHVEGSIANRGGWYYQIDDIEVIGNIHDNQELLKQ